MRFNPKPLIAAVKASMTLPPFVEGEGPAMVWVRPPLMTDLKLNGLKLSDYTSFSRKAGYDAVYLVDVAERYLSVFALYPEDYAEDGTPNPCRWIRNNLGMDRTAEAWLFPTNAQPHIRNDVWRHFATLLWWISGHGGTLTFDDTNIICEIDGFRVGVEHGRIVSPLLGPDVSDYVVPPTDWRACMTERQSGAVTRCKNLAWNRVWRQAQHLPNREAVQMALLILHARVPDKRDILKHLYPPRVLPTNTPLHKMGRMADNLLTDPDPYTRLRNFMVPHWMSGVIFKRVFLKPEGAPDMTLRAAWRDFLFEEFDLYSYKNPSRK